MKRVMTWVLAGWLLTSAGARAAGNDAAELRRLRQRVAALERRVATLEGRRRPTAEITIRYPAPSPKPALSVDSPLDERRRAAVAAAREAVDRADAAVRRRMKGPGRFAQPGLDERVEQWAAAARSLAVLLAAYGQERACLSALARFHARRNRTDAARHAFEQAAFRCAVIFSDQWEAPESALRIAAAYGPRSVDLGASWGALCEQAARASGKREHLELALRCYLRAAVVGNLAHAWRRVRRLEAELKASR